MTTLFPVFPIPIPIVIGVLTTGATQTAHNQSGQVARTSSGGNSVISRRRLSGCTSTVEMLAFGKGIVGRESIIVG